MYLIQNLQTHFGLVQSCHKIADMGSKAVSCILCARLLFLVVISNDGMLKSPASSIQAEHDIFILPRHCAF